MIKEHIIDSMGPEQQSLVYDAIKLLHLSGYITTALEIEQERFRSFDINLPDEELAPLIREIRQNVGQLEDLQALIDTLVQPTEEGQEQ